MRIANKNFKYCRDVVRMGYRLIVFEHTVFSSFIKDAKPDTALREIYEKNDVEFLNVNASKADAYQILKANRKSVFLGNIDGFDAKFIPDLIDLLVEDRLINAVGFALTKNSELRRMFNYHLVRIKENGLLKKINLKYPRYKGHKREEKPERDALLQLGFGNVVFLFMIVLVGILLSVLLVVVEKTLH